MRGADSLRDCLAARRAPASRAPIEAIETRRMNPAMDRKIWPRSVWTCTTTPETPRSTTVSGLLDSSRSPVICPPPGKNTVTLVGCPASPPHPTTSSGVISAPRSIRRSTMAVSDEAWSRMLATSWFHSMVDPKMAMGTPRIRTAKSTASSVILSARRRMV